MTATIDPDPIGPGSAGAEPVGTEAIAGARDESIAQAADLVDSVFGTRTELDASPKAPRPSA